MYFAIRDASSEPVPSPGRRYRQLRDTGAVFDVLPFATGEGRTGSGVRTSVLQMLRLWEIGPEKPRCSEHTSGSDLQHAVSDRTSPSEASIRPLTML